MNSFFKALPPAALESAYASAIHASQEAVLIVDERQRIVLINPAAQRMFECTEASAIGSNLSRFIPERFRDAHVLHVDDFVNSGAAERPMWGRAAICGLRSNGTEFPAQAMITRVDVPGDSGPRRYFTALVHDLSHEHGLKADIDALNERMRSIFDMAPIAIWLTDGDTIIYANAVCNDLFAAPDHASLIGRSIYSLLHAESHETVRQNMAQVCSSNVAVSRVHEQIARLDGHHRDVDIAMAALPGHDRSVLQMVITDVSHRTQERLALEQSRHELRRLSANQVEAREAERRHIARELHDELGQRLTSLKMELSSLAPKRRTAKGDRIASMLEMVDDTVASVRRISSDLRPLMLDDLGLNAAIEWLARESQRRMGIEVACHLDATLPAVSEPVTIAVYRIVQEALTNVARHARATRVHIETKGVGGQLLLAVEDNGVGLPARSIGREGSHGLIGIRERAHMLGGRLEIGTVPGGGTRVAVTLPLELVESVFERKDERAPSAAEATTPTQEPTHDLHGQQIKLEMQNEELLRTQIELAATRDRFVDLYDYAPVGYLTLDGEGVIIEANLTAASMLGKNRHALIGRRFDRSVAPPDFERWQRHLRHALQHDGTHGIELLVRADNGSPFHAQIDCARKERSGSRPSLRMTLTDITQRRKSEMDRRVAVATVGASEAERRRVARELHEELGQRLSALKMDLSSLSAPPNGRRVNDLRIADMIRTLDASLATVRRITSELRPLLLDDLGLNAAIDWLAREAARRHSIDVTLSLDEHDPQLDETRSIALFRMLQSTLAEVARHGVDRGLHIALQQHAGELTLTVEASGSGHAADTTEPAFEATALMREQAHMLGGELTVDRVAGTGRRITVRLPLRLPSAA